MKNVSDHVYGPFLRHFSNNSEINKEYVAAVDQTLVVDGMVQTRNRLSLKNLGLKSDVFIGQKLSEDLYNYIVFGIGAQSIEIIDDHNPVKTGHLFQRLPLVVLNIDYWVDGDNDDEIGDLFVSSFTIKL